MSEVRAFALPDVGRGPHRGGDPALARASPGDVGEGQPDDRRDRDGQGVRRAAVPVRGHGGRAAASPRARSCRWARRSSPSRRRTRHRRRSVRPSWWGTACAEGGAEPRRRRRTGRHLGSLSAATPSHVRSREAAGAQARPRPRDRPGHGDPTGAHGEVTRADVLGAGGGARRRHRLLSRLEPGRPVAGVTWTAGERLSRHAGCIGRWRMRWSSRPSPRRMSPSGSTST